MKPALKLSPAPTWSTTLTDGGNTLHCSLPLRQIAASAEIEETLIQEFKRTQDSL
jgi:hypothetical protein